jgi:hypothetical protein
MRVADDVSANTRERAPRQGASASRARLLASCAAARPPRQECPRPGRPPGGKSAVDRGAAKSSTRLTVKKLDGRKVGELEKLEGEIWVCGMNGLAADLRVSEGEAMKRRDPDQLDLFVEHWLGRLRGDVCVRWPECGCGTQSGPHSCEGRER